MKFEELLKIVEEEDKELQVEELTSLKKMGQDSYFILLFFEHYHM